MGVLYQSPDLALPWSSSKQEDRKFKVIAIIFIVLTIALGFVIQGIEVPELSKAEKKKIPDSLAKIIKERKKEPPKPKVEVKKEKKPEKKKEKKKKPPPPKTEQEKKAREKAAKKLKEDFDKLKKNWDHIAEIKEYYFVYNDKYAGAKKPEEVLSELRKENPNIIFDLFLAENLEDVF